MNERKVMMNYKLMVLICSGMFLACAGCKTTANQTAENQPPVSQPATTQAVAAQPVAAHIKSKRVYDTSYIPRSLYSKVNPNGDGYINKPFVVHELVVDGRCVYEVTNNGAANYYDDGGTELAGAEKERISSQVKSGP